MLNSLNKRIPTTKGIFIIILAAIIAGSGILAYQYWWMPEEIEIQPQFSTKDETADWKTYTNPEADFTFEYPSNWEIIDDYFYETASGIKAKQRTIILQEIGNKNSNDWIRMNPRQFQSNVGKCKGSFCTYSEKIEVLNIFNKVAESFKKKETDDWKVYRNEEYGFEFQYPQIYDQEDYKSCRVSNVGESFYVGSRSSLDIVDSKGLDLATYVYEFIKEKEKKPYNWKIEPEEGATIGENGAHKISYRFGGTDRYGTASFFKKDGKIFIFSFSAGNFVCDYEAGSIFEFDVYDQMLSTFKFIKTKDEFEVIKRIPDGTLSYFVERNKIIYGALNEVSIVFNREIDESTLTMDHFYVLCGINEKVSGKIEYKRNIKTATLVFDFGITGIKGGKIGEEVRVTVVIEGIEDLERNQIQRLVYNIDILE